MESIELYLCFLIDDLARMHSFHDFHIDNTDVIPDFFL